MPFGPRIRHNNVYGTISDNPLLIGAPSFTSLGLSLLPAVLLQHAVIVFDPKRVNGPDPEIVVVTSHLAMGTTATISRGTYGTVARQHPQGTAWAHVPIDEDFTEIVTSITRPLDPYQGQTIFETDTVSFKFWNGSAWVSFGGGGGGGGATLGYNQVTASSATFTTTETELVSVTVTVPTGRRLKVTTGTGPQSNNTDSAVRIRTRDGGLTGTEIGYDDKSLPVAGVKQNHLHEVIYSPSAGSHTFASTIVRVVGTGTITNIADAVDVTWILVEDITSSEIPFSNSNVPVGSLGFAIKTTDQNAIGAGPTTITGLSVNVTVPDGRQLKITTQFQTEHSDATSGHSFDIHQDGVSIGRAGLIQSGGGREWVDGAVLISPVAGSHTYTVVVTRYLGAGTVDQEASTATPAFLYVEDVTSTPTAASGAPSSTLAYAEVTTGQSGITSVVDLTGLTVTITVPPGRRIAITANIETSRTVPDGTTRLSIKEGATFLQIMDNQENIASDTCSLNGQAIITPSAGTHTYKLTLERASGTGTVALGASTNSPSFILVEDITGAVHPAGSQVTAGLIASEPWTIYTPILTATTTNPTLGTGGIFVQEGRFIQYGKMVSGSIKLAFGNSGATAGSGTYRISLPVAPLQSTATATVIGHGFIFDSSAADMRVAYIQTFSGLGSQVVEILFQAVTNFKVTNSSPWTWAASDEMAFNFQYEAL